MDQDSFRKLLQGSSTLSNAERTPRPTLTANTKTSKSKTKKPDSAQPTFKPRAVKKANDRYRDRAEERRLGLAHDYAQVEALAEDFERRNADQDRAVVEEQRQYLGGDSDHTVLVKGLDFALLEQNKARATVATEDDDELEQAYEEALLPKKRTREDILNELKNKRQKGDTAQEGEGAAAQATDASLEEAKKAGKFKPIGFKPIGSTEGTKKKKNLKAKEDKGKDKASAKKRDRQPPQPGPSQQPQVSTSKPPPPEPEPEPVNEDFDIFAGAGEYTGVDLGDESESEGEVSDKPGESSKSPASQNGEAPSRGRWFDISEPEPPRQLSTPPARLKSPSAPLRGESAAPEEMEEGEEEEKPVRLAPLASSAIPSIRDFLALDVEAEKQKKRKARKEKKKGLAKSSEITSD